LALGIGFVSFFAFALAANSCFTFSKVPSETAEVLRV
jgi:hypothetical protein